MQGKRSRIRQTIARAQRRGKVINPRYLASCEGKIRHSKEDAKARAKGISTMKFYKCEFGDHYHVGRRPNWKRTKGKK